MKLVRLGAGVLALFLAIASTAVTALWAYGKAFGSEFEICPREACYSGWFGVAVSAALTLVFFLIGRRLLGGAGQPARPR